MNTNFPTLNDQLLSLAKEIKNSVTKKVNENVDLFASSDVVDERLSICNVCEHYINGRCKLCGCFMEAKVKINTAKCPARKWGYKTVLVTGAGGFIGGHLVKRLYQFAKVIAVDKKPSSEWYQTTAGAENIVGDLTDYNFALEVTKNVNEVYHLACDMGGMGFIESNKTLCMLSIIPDVNTLKASHANNVKKFLFGSTACVYPSYLQNKEIVDGLKEGTEYPADPEDGYGWEKLFMERMCRHYTEDFNIQTRIVRYHNVYGTKGTWHGGREKAPAALCRKIAEAVHKKQNYIDIWGDGQQTRSFLYVDDAVDGTIKVMESDNSSAFNIGSDRLISINDLSKIIQKIAGVELTHNYIEGPLGVRGRSSNNDKVRQILKWEPKIKLEDGLKTTYDWILEQYHGLYNCTNQQQ
jgi:GDP-D-mannose 3', 5'-epimerase